MQSNYAIPKQPPQLHITKILLIHIAKNLSVDNLIIIPLPILYFW